MERLDGAGGRRDPGGQSALVAAYREGLGLAAVAVICGPAGIRIAAAGQGADGALLATGAVLTRWWCRRAIDAERVAAAATVRLRGRESRDQAAPQPTNGLSHALDKTSGAFFVACESIVSAARRLNVVLRPDEEILAEAMTVVARVDEEIERLRRAGELKSINKSYRAYRIEGSARGEKVVRYAEWMSKYREDLVRRLAAALRYA